LPDTYYKIQSEVKKSLHLILVIFISTVQLSELQADHFMGGQLSYETIDLDTVRGVYKVVLKVERPCNSFNTFHKEYAIKVLEYSAKRSPGYSLSVYSAKIFDSSYIYYPCTSPTATCANSGGQVIEIRYYKVNIVVPNSKKECLVYFDEYSNRTYSDNLVTDDDPMVLYTSFIPCYTNTQVNLDESKRHFPLKNQWTNMGYTISDAENDSISFRTSLPFKALNYTIASQNLTYTLVKSQVKLGLNDNRPFNINESAITVTPNSVQFTPSEVQSSWLTLVKSEFRKINIGAKDTWICISKSNQDRLVSVFNISSQFQLHQISSSSSAVKISAQQITICNNGQSNPIKFHFPIEPSIKSNKLKVFLGSTEITNQFSASRKVNALMDTLILDFNYVHNGLLDLSTHLRFEFELCHTNSGIGFDKTIQVPFYVFNYKVFDRDTILSCTQPFSIPTLLNKGLTTNWGNYISSSRSISFTNPKDSWIKVQLTQPNPHCPSRDSIYLNHGSIFTISTLGYSPSCKGYTDAAAKVMVTGTNGPYTYRWTNNSTLDSIGSVAAGIHIIEVSDKDNCKLKDTIVIAETQGIEAQWVMDSQITCYGGSDGKGHIKVTSSLKPNNYLWTNVIAVDSFLNHLSAGNYYGIYKYINHAGNACDQNFNFIIPQPDSMYMKIISTDNTCFGEAKGKIAVIASGGHGDYKYYFDNVESTVGFISNLANGNVNIYVKDGKGCTTSNTVSSINSPTRLKYTMIAENPSCAEVTNGKLMINHPTGGVLPYLYSFSGGNYSFITDFISLGLGTYNIKMRDANDCILSQNFTLNPQYILSANLDLLENSRCPKSNSGKIHLDMANGASPYNAYINSDSTLASPASIKWNNLPKGSYNIKVIDSNKCSYVTQFKISEPDSLRFTSAIIHETCFGSNNGQINIQNIFGGTAPYSSQRWYNASNALIPYAQNLMGGWYTLRFEDSKNCNYEYSFYVIPKPAFIVNLEIAEPITCHGYINGKIKSKVMGGKSPLNYVWQLSPVQTGVELSNLEAGNYKLEVKDADQCVAIDSINLPQPNPIKLESLKLKDQDCPNLINGALTISCLNSDGSGTNLQYKLKNLTEYTSLNSFTNLNKGNYTILVKDEKGCEKEFNGELKINKEIQLELPTVINFELGEEKEIAPKIKYGLNTILADIKGYNWTPKTSLSCSDCMSTKYTGTKSETYSIEINYGEGCVVKESVFFDVAMPEDLYIPNSFSPNGDDKNDVWYVYGKNIISIDIKVINRVGEIVFSSYDINKGWDGTYQGKKESINAYKYLISVTYAGRSQRFYEGIVNLFR
jgi:gliding motility-associated-like protein